MILKMINKIVALTIIFTLVFEQSGFAQVAGPMGIPAYINGYVSPDKFRPLQLRSLSFDQINNDFNLFLDKGDLRDLKPREIKENGAKLSEYFQIGLRLPNSTFWVNLRPDAQDQIIDPWLEKTDLGKVMLEADLQLKKDMANFTSPQTPEGKNYWDNLYKKAEELFGQSEITIPTLTRPWIVPGEILIRQTKDNAYIYKAALNVMLEQDYLKDAPEYKFDDPRLKTLNQYSSELIRQEILPKLTREVNSSKNYAGLRQVYYSLVLAQWFKQSHQDDSRIDNFGLSGLTSKKSWSKTTYFKAYKNSFAKGEYKLQETVSRLSGTSIRQYFSGGEKLVITPNMISVINPAAAGDIANQPSLPDSLKSGLIEVQGGNVINDGQQQLRKKDGGSAQEVKDGVDQSFKDKLNFLAANLSAPPSVSSADEGGSDTAGDHYWDKLEKVVKGVITSRKEYDDFMTNLNKEISKAGISGILSWLFHPIYNVRLDRVYNKLGALGTRNTLSFREDSASQLEPGLVRLNNGFTAPENLVQEAWNKLEIGDNHDRFMANALSMSARFPGIFELTAQEEAFWKKEGILREDGSLDPVIRNIVLSSFDGDGAFELRVRDPKASDKKDGGNKQAVSFDKVDYRKAQNYGMALATGMWWVAVVTGSLIMVSSLGWLVGVSALAAGIFLMMFTGSSTADFITDKVVFRLMYGETRSQNLERFGKMEIIQDPKRDGGAQALTENKPGNIFVRPFIALWKIIVTPGQVNKYIEILNDHKVVRSESEEAARKLGELGSNKAVKPLKKYLVEVVLGDNYDVAPAAEEALRKLELSNRDIERIYLEAFKDTGFHRVIRRNAVEVLGKRVGQQLSFAELSKYSGETDMIVKWAIDKAIPEIAKRLKEDSAIRDGGTASTSSTRVQELYSAINEIRWMASSNEDFVVKRLARVEGMIKENKYTPDEIRMVEEQFKSSNLMTERINTGKIDFVLLLVGSVFAGGATIGAFVLSGISVIPMIIGIGMTVGFGLGAAYRLNKLFKRDIPLQNLNDEYYKEVGKMLAVAGRDGGNELSLDQLRMDLMTNDVHPEIFALQGLRNDFLDLADLIGSPAEKAKWEKTAKELNRVVAILEQDEWPKSLQAGELNNLQNGDILILDPKTFAIYHSHEYLPATGKYTFLLTKVDRNDPAKTPVEAIKEQLDIAGIQVLPVAPKDSEEFLNFIRKQRNASSRDGGENIDPRISDFFKDIKEHQGAIDKAWVRERLAKHKLLDNIGGPARSVFDAIEVEERANSTFFSLFQFNGYSKRLGDVNSLLFFISRDAVRNFKDRHPDNPLWEEFADGSIGWRDGGSVKAVLSNIIYRYKGLPLRDKLFLTDTEMDAVLSAMNSKDPAVKALLTRIGDREFTTDTNERFFAKVHPQLKSDFDETRWRLTVSRDGGSLTAKDVLSINLRQFIINENWRRVFENSKGSILVDIGSGRKREGHMPAIFGIINDKGVILHVSNSAELVDGILAVRGKGLYEFNLKGNIIIVDERLGKNTLRIKSIIKSTFKSLDKEMAARAGAKDGGKAMNVQDGVLEIMDQIKEKVKNNDQKALEDLAVKLMKAQSEQIINRFSIFGSVASGMSLSALSAIRLIEKKTGKQNNNSDILSGAGEIITAESAIDGLKRGIFTARMYNLFERGNWQTERLVLFDTAKGLQEKYRKDGGSEKGITDLIQALEWEITDHRGVYEVNPHRDSYACGKFARKLGDLGDSRAVNVLLKLYNAKVHSNYDVFAQKQAMAALKKIAGKVISQSLSGLTVDADNKLVEASLKRLEGVSLVFKIVDEDFSPARNLLVPLKTVLTNPEVSFETQIKAFRILQSLPSGKQFIQKNRKNLEEKSGLGMVLFADLNDKVKKDGGEQIDAQELINRFKTLANDAEAMAALENDLVSYWRYHPQSTMEVVKYFESLAGEYTGSSSHILLTGIRAAIKANKYREVKNLLTALAKYPLQAPESLDAAQSEAYLVPLREARDWLDKVEGLKKVLDKVAVGKDGGTDQPPAATGGVDFRALPAIVTPMANPAAAGAGLISLKDLDKQWSQIQSKIYQGEMPYQEIKLYVSSCCGQKVAAKQLEQISEGITNILKMEEDRALPTAPELKEILVCLG